MIYTGATESRYERYLGSRQKSYYQDQRLSPGPLFLTQQRWQHRRFRSEEAYIRSTRGDWRLCGLIMLALGLYNAVRSLP